MSPKTERARVWFSTVAFLCVLALVAVIGLAFAAARPASTKYTAMLSSVIGLYPGSDVRVLGVPVGKIDEVTPRGREVRVAFHVDHGVQLPAEAKAVLISPTVVADRFLQLAPAYTGGPTLQDGATIPNDRTASPAEFDDLLASVQKLSTSLGPQGVNDNGALSEALHTLAQNLDGNGQRINTTLGNFSQAVGTLSASRQNLAGTVDNLQSFTTNLKQNDGQVRAFTQQFAQVNSYLAGERQNLGETLKELSITLGQLAVFVHDNRASIRGNVDKLGDILETVNRERASLEQALDTAPAGLDGLVNGYNASSGTLDTRAALVQSIVCGLVNIQGLGTILGPLLPPDLTAGCAPGTMNPLPLALPSLPAGSLAALKVPKPPLMLGKPAAGLAPSLPGLPGAPAGGQPAGQTPDQGATAPAQPAEPSRSPDPSTRNKPDKPSNPLGDLLGGGR